MPFIKNQKAHNFEDLTGCKFDRLYVESRAGNSKAGQSRWNCFCSCGNRKTISAAKLKSGNTKSCGCLQKESRLKHGKSKSKSYETWLGMRDRCYNSNNIRYNDYGGRGISICDCIADYETFYNYVSKLEHFGEKGYTIDRINNDGNYCICTNNLKWSTYTEQNRNQRIPATNKTGAKGVQARQRKDKIVYEAFITLSDKKKSLGYYATIEEAANVRKQAELKYWG